MKKSENINFFKSTYNFCLDLQSMKLLIALIGAGSALPSAEVSRDLPIDGAFWTQWSTYYGCSQFQFDEFCRYPNKAKLSAYRYRVCVLPDLRNYPQNLFDNQKRQGEYHLIYSS